MASFFKSKSDGIFHTPTEWSSITDKPDGIDDAISSINESRYAARKTSLTAETTRSKIKDVINNVLLAPFMVCSVTVKVSAGTSVFTGASEIVNNGVWSIDYGDGTSTKLPMSAKSIPSHTYSEAGVYTIRIRRASIKTIGTDCFKNCAGLLSISLPNSITSFGSSCFYGCYSLTSLSLPEKLTAIGESCFEGCTSITSMEIPESVTSLGGCCFKDCTALVALSLLREEMYTYNNQLSGVPSPQCTVFVPDVVYSEYSASGSGWSAWPISPIQQFKFTVSANTVVFDGETVVSSSSAWVVDWGDGSEESLPSTTTRLPKHTYAKSGTYIARVRLAVVEEICDSCFEDDSGLVGVILPIGVERIGESAFSDCVNLKSVTLPTSLESLGDSCFEGCSELNVSIMGETGRSSSSATTDLFGYMATVVLYQPENYSLYNVTSELMTVDIPSNVTTIGSYCFANCTSLVKLDLKSGLLSIGSHCCDGCSYLSYMALPSTLVSLGDYAFFGCRNLTALSIPASLTTIGSRCFNKCSSLSSIQVSSSNTQFDSRNGCHAIVEKATNKILFGSSSTIIPTSVVELGAYCFNGISVSSGLSIPTSVATLGNYCFAECTTLTSSVLSPNVSSLGAGCYSGCSNLKSLTLHSNRFYSYSTDFLKDVPNGDDGCVIHVLPSLVDTYKVDTNWNYWEIESVDTARAVKVTVANNTTVFSGDSIVTKSGDVEVIWGDGSVSYHNGTQWITLGTSSVISTQARDNNKIPTHTYSVAGTYDILLINGSLSVLDSACFANCGGLSYIYIPESVTTIGSTCFSGCTNVTYDMYGTTGRSSSSAHSDIFSSGATVNLYAAADYVLCGVISTGMKVAVDESVSAIGKGAFSYCTGLTSVTLNEGLLTIGANCFQNDTGLSSVTIPATVTTIGNSCFYNCQNLAIDLKGVTGRTSSSTSTDMWGDGANVKIYNADSYLFYNILSSNLTVTFDSAVTVLGSSLFHGCENLASVTLPSTISVLNSNTFYGCKSLPQVTIPPTVTSIGDRCFYNCQSFSAVTIPSSVVSIGTACFFGCSGLSVLLNGTTGRTSTSGSVDLFGSGATITIPHDLADSILEGVVSSNMSVVLTSAVGEIGNRCFANCTGLASATLPDSLTKIGNSAFLGCVGLPSITFPSSLVSIGQSAFEGCTGLSSITIPSSVTSIGDDCFKGCSGVAYSLYGATGRSSADTVSTDLLGSNATITMYGVPDYSLYNVSSSSLSVSIASSVTSLGTYSFGGCTGLSSVSIPSSVSSIGSNCFSGCSSLQIDLKGSTGINSTGLANDMWGSGATLTVYSTPSYFLYNVTSQNLSVVISSSQTSIFTNSFENCTGLTSVSIPSSVQYLANRCFCGCSSLPSITLPTGLISIGNDAFSGCTSLLHVTNGEADTLTDVQTLGDGCFQDCTGLTIMKFRSTNNNLYFGDDVFNGCSGVYFHLYCGTNRTSSSTASDVFGSGAHLYLMTTTASGSNPYQEYGFYNITSSMTALVYTGELSNPDLPPHLFENCTGLTSVSFYDQPLQTEKIKSIEASAFNGCTSLSTIIIPSTVTSIAENAFKGCTALTSFVVPDATTTLGSGVFEGCTSLATLTLGSGLTTVGNTCFKNTKLATLSIPSTVTDLGDEVLYGVGTLTELELPREAMYTYHTNMLEGVPEKTAANPCLVLVPYEYIETYTADSNWNRWLIKPTASIIKYTISGSGGDSLTCRYYVSTFKNATYRGSSTIELPSGMNDEFFHDPILGGQSAGEHSVSLSGGTFDEVQVFRISNIDGDTQMTAIEFPEGVQRIGYSTYPYSEICSIGSRDLQTVTFPSGLNYIAPRTFKNTSIEEIEIKTSVLTMDLYSFVGAKSLRKIVITNDSSIIEELSEQDKIVYIGEDVSPLQYQSVIFGFGCFSGCTGLNGSNVVIKSTAQYTIHDSCFSGCSGLKFDIYGGAAYRTTTGALSAYGNQWSITLHRATAPQIGYLSYPSGECTLTFASEVTNIPDECCWYNRMVTKITIGVNCVKIGKHAFGNCDSLSQITILSNTMISDLGDDIFKDTTTSGITLYVKAELVSQYQSHSVWGQCNVQAIVED